MRMDLKQSQHRLRSRLSGGAFLAELCEDVGRLMDGPGIRAQAGVDGFVGPGCAGPEEEREEQA